MPIANCYIKNREIPKNELEDLVRQWAELWHIDVSDICLTVLTEFMQVGQQYEVMINLFLPSLWSNGDVRSIQKALLELMMNYLKIEPSDIFLMTSIIQSGHVMENGGIVEWKK